MFKVIACGACQHCFRREISTCVACRSGTPLTAVGIQRQRAPTAPAWTPCRWPSTAPCPPPPLLSPPLLSSLCHSPPQPLQVRRTGHKSVSNAVQAESVLTQCVLGLRVAACVTAVSQPVASPTVNVGTRSAPRCCQCGLSCARSTTRGKWPRLKHHPRCPSAAQSASAAAGAATSKPTHKRRAESDPGQLAALTRSVHAPAPAAPLKKQRTRKEERIMRLLDETHARRMAAQQQQ